MSEKGICRYCWRRNGDAEHFFLCPTCIKRMIQHASKLIDIMDKNDVDNIYLMRDNLLLFHEQLEVEANV